MKNNISLVIIFMSVTRILFSSIINPDNSLNSELECEEEIILEQRQECLYGDEQYSPDNSLIRDLIDLDLVEHKTIRVSFYSFINNNELPFWNESDYLNVIEDLNNNFADSKITFSATYNSVNNENLITCYENDYQEKECLSRPQCSYDRWNHLCYFDKYWIADKYNHSNDSIYVFIGRYKANNGSTPWRNQSIPYNRSVFLTQNSYTNNSKTVTHEFGHKFGLLHTFHGVFSNNGDCQNENSCWSIPTFDQEEFCDGMTIDECALHLDSCYWDDNISYCGHIRDASGDLCSDTYPIPPSENSSLCIFPEAECNEIIYDYSIEHYNYNFMEYGNGCDEYYFTDQQIQRMHGWIEYNYEYQPNIFSNLCNFIEDYDCKLFGCNDPYACNFTSGSLINNGSCEYELDNPNCSILGDINNDSILDILDIILIINMILDNEFYLVADVNVDGTLNVIDIVLLLETIIN